MLLIGKLVVLPQSETTDRAGHKDGADWPGVEAHRVRVCCERARHRRRRHRRGCRRLFLGTKRLLGLFLSRCDRAAENERCPSDGAGDDAFLQPVHFGEPFEAPFEIKRTTHRTGHSGYRWATGCTPEASGIPSTNQPVARQSTSSRAHRQSVYWSTRALTRGGGWPKVAPPGWPL